MLNARLPSPAPRPPSLLPGPFVTRPLARRGLPWGEKEKREVLFDGYGPSHEVGIMGFEAPAEGYASLPPDVQAYFALIHRIKMGGPSVTIEELCQTPVGLDEIENGASLLREARSMNRGIFVKPGPWMKVPVSNPSRDALWAQSLQEYVKMEGPPVKFGVIYTGHLPEFSAYLTNIRPAFPSYIKPIGWEDLLGLALRLYQPLRHPIALVLLNYSTEQDMMDSMVYNAVVGRVNLWDEELYRLEFGEEMEQQSEGTTSGQGRYEGIEVRSDDDMEGDSDEDIEGSDDEDGEGSGDEAIFAFLTR